MDNIKDENLKRLGKYIAEALIDQAMRQGKIDHPKLLEGMAGTAESYETTVKPQKIESA